MGHLGSSPRLDMHIFCLKKIIFISEQNDGAISRQGGGLPYATLVLSCLQIYLLKI
jgi:hypothetical protein